MLKLSLAIISDLHIGETARAKDLCPHADYNGIEEKYIQKFIKFIEKEKIRADYMIGAGDITGKADHAEFELATNAICQIGNALNIPEETILFVPGNHDKVWKNLNSDEKESAITNTAESYQFLKLDNWIFDRILRRSDHYMLSENCIAIWNFDDLIVVGYNSSWHDHSAAKPHHGLVTESSLHWLEEQLINTAQLNLKVKIFLVHHHPFPYSDPISDWPDHSIMTNSENLLNLLNKFKFDLFLHGHKHIPRFKSHVSDSGFPLIVLGAGSFSYQLGYSYNGHASNLFHLLEIDGRDEETEYIAGCLRNWSFHSGHGWKLSSKHDGIMPRIGFGTHTTHNEIKKKLIPIIRSNLEHANYVKWKDLVSNDSKLKYLSPERVISVLKEIATEEGLEYWGDDPENSFLLPKDSA